METNEARGNQHLKKKKGGGVGRRSLFWNGHARNVDSDHVRFIDVYGGLSVRTVFIVICYFDQVFYLFIQLILTLRLTIPKLSVMYIAGDKGGQNGLPRSLDSAPPPICLFVRHCIPSKLVVEEANIFFCFQRKL